jgi:hypothetical protein
VAERYKFVAAARQRRIMVGARDAIAALTLGREVSGAEWLSGRD